MIRDRLALLSLETNLKTRSISNTSYKQFLENIAYILKTRSSFQIILTLILKLK
jgi:hypothetical protein